MKPTIKLVHDRRKNGKGTLEIKVYFPPLKKQVYIATGYSVDKQYFDPDIKQISPDVKDYQSINVGIKLMIQEIKELLNSLEYRLKREVLPTEFSFEYKRLKSNTQETTKLEDFLSFFEDQIKKAKELSPGTIVSYKSTLSLLKKYRAIIPFTSLDYEFAIGFDRWLREKYTNLNTIRKHDVILRKFVSLATKLSLIPVETSNSFMLFTSKGQSTNKDYLLPEEIKLIEDLKLPKGSKEYDVKQMFLLAYYTALRISDILSLDKSHFYTERKELHLKKIIHKLRKYNREININLTTTFNGKGAKLINLYLKEDNELLFKGYTPIMAYDNLKKIIKKVGIEKTVSFHTARHSSLTAIAALTGDPFKVMLHGGITSISTAQRYIHLSKEMFGSKLEGLENE